MKTQHFLALLCSSLFLGGSSFSANTTTVDVQTVESPAASSNDKDDDKSKTASFSGTTPNSQMYIPQTDDDEEEKPKKSRKKRAKKGASKIITSVSEDKMPLAKGNAVCPIGLEGGDAREIFRGFSYEGFQKSSTEGEANLNHGFLPKPWGFYKGKDGINYAVYAFKPDEKNIDTFLGESVSPLKLTRLKIKEYCALYTEVGEEFSNNNGKGRVGLVVSRDSFFKPKPLDPGAVKVAAVMYMIQKGQTSLPVVPNDKKDDASKDKKGMSDDAKIFQKMSDEDKAATSPKADDTATKTDSAASDAPKDAMTDATKADDTQKTDDAKPADDKAAGPSTDDATKGSSNPAEGGDNAKPSDDGTKSSSDKKDSPAGDEETPVQPSDMLSGGS